MDSTETAPFLELDGDELDEYQLKYFGQDAADGCTPEVDAEAEAKEADAKPCDNMDRFNEADDVCDTQLMAVMCEAQIMLIKGGDLFTNLTLGNFSFIVEKLSTLGVPQELILSLVDQAMECQEFHDSLVGIPSGLDDLD